MANVGNLRVSTDKQNYDGQKLSILNVVNDHLKGRVPKGTKMAEPQRGSASVIQVSSAGFGLLLPLILKLCRYL